MTTKAVSKNITRRHFLRLIGWGSFFVSIGIAAGSFLRFFFPRVLFERPSSFSIGSADDFRVNGNSDHQVYETWKTEHAVWIVREKNRLYAVHAKCTHLGCTPNYFAEEKIFRCPCHGSQFYSDGRNFAGPATRPLDRLKIAIGADGGITVDKNRVYTFKDFDAPGAHIELPTG